MKRIHVVGVPGSGKSSLARELGRLMGVTTHELDDIAYEGVGRPATSPEQRAKEIDAILQEDSWITEGIYLGWTSPLLEAADTIVWLDVPWRVSAWRIFKRHVRRDLLGPARQAGYWRLLPFAKFCRRYYEDLWPTEFPKRRREIANALSPFAEAVRRCRSDRDVKALVSEFRE